MEQDWLSLILLGLVAMVKFGVFVPITIVSHGFGFVEALIFGMISGTAGILVFMFLSELLLSIWHRFARAMGWRKSKRPKKVFSKKNRRLVRIKSRFGLPGIAFLTPVLLSIPVGTFLATRYFKNKKKVFLYLELGLLIWSLIFALFATTVETILKTLNMV